MGLAATALGLMAPTERDNDVLVVERPRGDGQKGGAMSDHGPLVPIDPDLGSADPAAPAIGARPRVPRRRTGSARPDVLAVIALGGMIGATARFKLAEAIPTKPGHFPWATFWTNLSGSFVLGFSLILLLERFPPTRYVRPFLATGILGGYTTMSTYMVETAVLVKDGHSATAAVYCASSLVIGLAVANIGMVAARLTPERHRRSAPKEER
jgi:CrcB protein